MCFINIAPTQCTSLPPFGNSAFASPERFEKIRTTSWHTEIVAPLYNTEALASLRVCDFPLVNVRHPLLRAVLPADHNDLERDI